MHKFVRDTSAVLDLDGLDGDRCDGQTAVFLRQVFANDGNLRVIIERILL